MKVLVSQLKEYVHISEGIESLAALLTSAGIEVDAAEPVRVAFDGVVAAEVVSTKPHPDAEKLRIASVFDGKETVQIVCGAPNCRPGMKTALAKIGASLPDGNGTFTIKKAKLRGVESFGMLCAADELGLSSRKEEGILELGPEVPTGTDLKTLYEDTLLSLSLTPNLGRCLGVYGIAREIAAFSGNPIRPLTPYVKETPSGSFSIVVETKEACPYYAYRSVEPITIAPSPFFLQRILELTGFRSVNRAVDVGNYVMQVTGQPLHCFDADKISGNTLFVSALDKEETVVTLDDVTRILPKGTLVIRDEKAVLAIAGILGTKVAEVSETTRRIVIEGARFDPKTIRKTMKALGIKTEASNRFEKGVDPRGVLPAITLACTLLQGDGTVSSPVIVESLPLREKAILCRPARVAEVLGFALSPGEIIDNLAKLEFVPKEENEDGIVFTIPSYRNDVNEEIDLIEEIARIYGFENLPKKEVRHISSPMQDDPVFLTEQKARKLFVGEGLREFLTCDLLSPSEAERTKEKHDPIETISVREPKSGDYSVLRTSLLAGLLEAVRYNLDRQNPNIAAFEVGRIHGKREGAYFEQSAGAVILSGAKAPYHHDPKPSEVDFFDLKGIVDNFLEGFGIRNTEYHPSCLHTLQKGRQARVSRDGIIIGVLGEVHPRLLRGVGIEKRVCFAELNLEAVVSLQSKGFPVPDLPLYPGSERDVTLTLLRSVSAETVLQAFRSSSSDLLETVTLLDIFEHEKLGSDRKNLTFRLVYRDKEKTIASETVETVHAELLQKVAKKLADCIL